MLPNGALFNQENLEHFSLLFQHRSQQLFLVSYLATLVSLSVIWTSDFSNVRFQCLNISMSLAASAGLGFLQFCNLNSFRTKFVLGFSFFMGVSVPQYFREYRSDHTQSGPRWVRKYIFNQCFSRFQFQQPRFYFCQFGHYLISFESSPTANFRLIFSVHLLSVR